MPHFSSYRTQLIDKIRLDKISLLIHEGYIGNEFHRKQEYTLFITFIHHMAVPVNLSAFKTSKACF
jgi:hypothetical protein